MGEQPVRGRREYDALRERVSDLEAALRALVAVEPLAACYQDYHYHYCLFCDVESKALPFPHKEDCPWVRARSLLGEGGA